VRCSLPSSFCETVVEMPGPNGSSAPVTYEISGPAEPSEPRRPCPATASPSATVSS
jgi:hypothetical protein